MAESDHVQRVFLGVDQPGLVSASAWLLEALARPGADLGGVLVVVPGGRAQRRLNELLAERCAGQAMVPPTVVTLGQLADRLLPGGGPRVASAFERLLAWSSVLREAEPEVLSAVAPRGPGRDDWPGWWALGEQVVAAADELGGQMLLVQDVAERVQGPGDVERWQALAELDTRYHALLGKQGQVDPHSARRDAVLAGACEAQGPVVLLATTDLLPVHERMMGTLSSPVHALVFADEHDAEGFDALGGLVGPYWLGRALGVRDEQVQFVDRPGDQARAVLDAVSRWASVEPTSADAITVGIGDPAMDGTVARTLTLAGLPARSAAGRPVGTARPTLLLRALAGFADGRRFDQLAALLRHPDAEAYVTRSTEAPATPWLTLLDRYATDHLAARPASGWLGDTKQRDQLDKVYQSACSLLPDAPGALRPLNDWAEAIGVALAAVYGHRSLNRHAEADRAVVAALEAIGGVLEQLAGLDASAAPRCTFAQAVTLVIAQAAGQTIPDPGGEPAIELVGYLELLLDDAPRLALTGMNEQHVPTPPANSALLSEGTRRALNLLGDEHRLARDGYALSAMLACRAPEHVQLIAGQRSFDGDPLMPSRLLLRGDDDTLVRRVSEFVADQGETYIQPPMLLAPGKHDRFLIPPPVLPDEPIRKLRVTAFRDYLACPYRFYLKHVRRLEPLVDRDLEMQPSRFGTLAHRALRILAGDDLRAVDDPTTIAERLSLSLDRVFEQAYGSDPPVAARVQAEQLRYRLDAFASVHARLVAEGWRIAHDEQRIETTIEVDGEPFTITGQIDRIDRHADGHYRLLDYKTSDAAKSPSQSHFKTIDGQREWADLQLPLYLDLSASIGIMGDAELGYLNLPKKRSESAYAQAGWSAAELASARATRDAVIRKLRAGVFWPPTETSDFDGLASLCGDAAADRDALITASTPSVLGGEV